MILVIGMKNCGKCMMTKNILDNKGIQYEYVLFNELSQEEKRKYLDLGKEKTGEMPMPMIIKDGKIITIQEV
jgi:glutaredoxin